MTQVYSETNQPALNGHVKRRVCPNALSKCRCLGSDSESS